MGPLQPEEQLGQSEALCLLSEELLGFENFVSLWSQERLELALVHLRNHESLRVYGVLLRKPAGWARTTHGLETRLVPGPT